MRRLFGNILLFLLILFAMFLVAEGAWRLFIAKGDLAREFDSHLGLINPANSTWIIRTTEFETTMRTNEDGFRGPSLDIGERQSNEVRILFIGDSFVEAKQVPEEQRFVERTGELLQKRLGRPVTVRALGMGAAEPARELLFYRNLGRQFDPDIVVHVLFPENDLLSFTGPYQFTEEQGVLHLEDVWIDTPPPCNWKCAILKRSQLAVQMYRFLRRVRETPSSDPVDGDFGMYTIRGQEKWKEERRFETTAALVAALQEDVQRDGARFLAVLMPGAFEIHAEWREEIEEKYATTDRDAWQPSQLIDSLADALLVRSISFMNLRALFLLYAADHPKDVLYYPLDPHLKPEGHRITAEAITEYILTLLSSSQ